MGLDALLGDAEVQWRRKQGEAQKANQEAAAAIREKEPDRRPVEIRRSPLPTAADRIDCSAARPYGSSGVHIA